MRLAVMNQRNAPNAAGLTAQQQKIFDMNNNMHGVGMQGPHLAMTYQTNTNPMGARKKVNTQQQNRSHSVSNNS